MNKWRQILNYIISKCDNFCFYLIVYHQERKKHLNISIKACSHKVKLLLNWETLNVRDVHADIGNKNCLQKRIHNASHHGLNEKSLIILHLIFTL